MNQNSWELNRRAFLASHAGGLGSLAGAGANPFRWSADSCRASAAGEKSSRAAGATGGASAFAFSSVTASELALSGAGEPAAGETMIDKATSSAPSGIDP